MDYKLIKENFERATAKLMQEKQYTSMSGEGMGSLASILVTKAFGLSTDDRLPFKVVAEKESEEFRNLPGGYRSSDVYVDITTHVDLSAKQKETFLKNFDRFVNRITKEAARMSKEGGFQGDVRAVGNAPGNKVSITLGYIDPRRSLLPKTPPKKETELKRRELGVTQNPSPTKEAVEAAEFTEQETDALEFLRVAINMFRGGQYGFASDVLEPLGTSRNAKVMEINTLAEQLVQELQELEKKIGMLIPDEDDGEPEEADYDTETGEFIGEETINEAINIPFNKNDNVVVMCAGVASAAQRMAATLTAASPDAIPYSVKAVGEGPERVDRAIQSEMARIGKMLQNISKKLFGQS